MSYMFLLFLNVVVSFSLDVFSFIFYLLVSVFFFFFFFSSRRRHTRSLRDWSSDVCSSDLLSDAGSDPIRRRRLETGHRPRRGELAARRRVGDRLRQQGPRRRRERPSEDRKSVV